MQPQVSVIIPAYNTAEYVGQALQSVLSQTEGSFEIIVCDDCSTDSTIDVVRSYAETDPRIHLIQNHENLGPSRSRNRAIHQAKGQWLALLDSDDYFDARRLKILTDLAKENDLDMIADNIHKIDSSGSIEKMSAFKFPVGRDPIEISTLIFLLNDMSGQSAKNWGFLKPIIRRKFLFDLGIVFDETTSIGEDFLLYVECLIKGARFGVIKDGFYYYRNVAGSLSRTGRPENLIELRKNNRKLIRIAKRQKDLPTVVLLGKRDRICCYEILYADAIKKIRSGQPITAIRSLLRRPRSWPFCFRKGLRYLQRDPGR